jgi:DNA-binding NtrC family response regulator
MDLEWNVRGSPGGSADPGSGGTLHTVHLLDQHSDWLLFLNEYLSNAGYQVTASSDTIDALQVVGRFHPEVLIADKDMPDLHDVDLLDRVRALSPATRVILTTEKLDRRLGDCELRMGGVDLVVKPFNWSVLLRAVERAIRK